MSERLWREEFERCGTLELWNQNILPRMRERGEEYKRVAHAEARRRLWRYSRDASQYEKSPPEMTAEEYMVVMAQVAKREIRKWLHKAPGHRIAQHGRRTTEGPSRMVPTRIKQVSAFWELTAADETGLLIVWDFRRNPMWQAIWNGVPRDLYMRLFAHDAKKALQDICTVFAGQELGPEEAIDAIHAIERDLLGAG